MGLLENSDLYYISVGLACLGFLTYHCKAYQKKTLIKIFKIEWLIYNMVLVSGVQHRDSTVYSLHCI